MLGLPPAFVLSQDQTLRFDHSILADPLEGYLQGGHCVLTSPDIIAATQFKELATARVSVNAVPPESHASMENHGLARTPPSAFPFLQANCQRACDRNRRCGHASPWKQMPPPESNTRRRISQKKRQEKPRSSFRKFHEGMFFVAAKATRRRETVNPTPSTRACQAILQRKKRAPPPEATRPRQTFRFVQSRRKSPNV